MDDERYTVGQVARIARTTVRTLHHYDAIGLLSPSERDASGYRRYTGADLDRLHQIRCYRELDLGLDQIAEILDDPGTDVLDHLRRQRTLLRERREALDRLVAALELMMEARTMGISLTPEERFEVFGDDDPAQHADEAQERWGDTDAYRQSQQRTSAYGKQEWLQIKEEMSAIERGLAGAMAADEPADGVRAMDLAEAHRERIARWFYDLEHEGHRGLAELYLADPRFTAHYERVAEGLARYVHDAIQANADRHAGGRARGGG